MKRHSLNLSRTAAVLILTGIASTSLLGAADPTPPAGGPATPGQGRAIRGNFQGGGRAGINLDEQQLQLLREAMQKNQDQLAKLGEQLRAAQKELLLATIGEKYDEKIVRQKAEAVAKIQTDLTMLSCQALSTVAPTLKPEQRQELENSPLAATMLTMGGMRGMGGMGGMGMGGGMGGMGMGGGMGGMRGPGGAPGGGRGLRGGGGGGGNQPGQ